MIKIECLSSPDLNATGIYDFGQNMIYIGRTNTDITLIDLAWPQNAMVLEVIDEQFFVHPQKDLEFFLVNGKRCTGVKKIKRNDLITLGETVFKLVDFSESHFKSKKQILDEKLGQLVSSNDPKLNIIRKLTEVMNQQK